jgi:hypothetical protein
MSSKKDNSSPKISDNENLKKRIILQIDNLNNLFLFEKSLHAPIIIH